MKLIRVLVDTRCDYVNNSGKNDYLSEMIESFGDIGIDTNPVIPYDHSLLLEQFENLGIKEHIILPNTSVTFTRISSDIISLENDDGDILYGKIIDVNEIVGAFIKASSYYRLSTFEYVILLQFE